MSRRSRRKPADDWDHTGPVPRLRERLDGVTEKPQVESVPRSPGQGYGNEEQPLYVDVAELLDDGLPDPPAPVFLRRTDGYAVFYAGQVNILFGDPESGKTLVALAAASEALIAGQRVAVIDIDHNGPEATIYRFLDMGAPEAALRDPNLFRYVEPDDRTHLRAVIADLVEWKPAIAVVDSIGELLPLLGLSSNSPDEFTAAHTSYLKVLAKAGTCTIGIDHLAKAADSRAQGSTGTAAKRRAVGGVSIRVVIEEQFTPGHGGSAYLTINKDRHGGLRRTCPVTGGREAVAGLFKIEPGDDGIKWSVVAPDVGDIPKADRVNPDDLAALATLNPPPQSVRDVKERLNWGAGRATRTLRKWRSRCSSSVPGEQGTLDEAGEEQSGIAGPEPQVTRVPRSPTPPPGNGEHDEDDAA